MRRAPDEQALFALLGVDEKASWDEVRRAFRAAVRASHPDLHVNDPDAEQRVKTLNASWESVNTPGKWAEYILPPASRGPTGSAARTRSRTARSSVGRLRVQRQRRGCVGMLSWTLEVDGEATASIKNGGVSVLEVAPGLRVFYGSHSSLPLSKSS
jgi:curved DNA-binding protein CbpA